MSSSQIIKLHQSCWSSFWDSQEWIFSLGCTLVHAIVDVFLWIFKIFKMWFLRTNPGPSLFAVRNQDWVPLCNRNLQRFDYGNPRVASPGKIILFFKNTRIVTPWQNCCLEDSNDSSTTESADRPPSRWTIHIPSHIAVFKLEWLIYSVYIESLSASDSCTESLHSNDSSESAEPMNRPPSPWMIRIPSQVAVFKWLKYQVAVFKRLMYRVSEFKCLICRVAAFKRLIYQVAAFK